MRAGPWLCVLAALLASCRSVRRFDGIDAVSGRSLQLVPGAMPAEHSFSGDYLSPQTGRTTLLQHEDRLSGSYERHSCGCQISGAITGTVEGNLAEVEWHEAVSGCPARPARRGEGFLFYTAPPVAQGPPKLFGERVYLVKQRVTRQGETLETQREPSAWTATRIFEAPLSDEPGCP
jgi:hypothetical protein